MKTIYICGDSFCSFDPDYPGGWVEHLQNTYPNYKVISLASPGASNFQIYLQVKYAIVSNCDYLIYYATSSIRHEFVINKSIKKTTGHSNYWNRSIPAMLKHMVCTSWITPEQSLLLSNQQSSLIKTFFKTFIDLDTEIEKNYLFISSTLNLINSAGIKNWIWCRGGFEHKNFSDSKQWVFDFADHEVDYNLWDYYDPNITRPYYHVTDKKILQSVCNQYINMLNLNAI